jgi:hypothetical protein
MAARNASIRYALRLREDKLALRMSTSESFDRVYAWHQQKMPAGTEKSHVDSPIQGAVFTIGDTSSGQSSVTLTTQGGKTIITIAHVKM